MTKPTITIASNNGDMGGGEVMLLNLARAMRRAGSTVTVLGPAQPGEVCEAAADEGFDTLALPAQSRAQYMGRLRAWDRQRQGVLWCNGLLPAVATSGHGHRVVHLHQLPRTTLQRALLKPARKGARVTLLPSDYAAARVPGSRAFYNWVDPVDMPLARRAPTGSLTVGFLGRPSHIKGTDILAQAVLGLRQAGEDYRLLIGGEPKFVDSADRQRVQRQLDSLGDAVEFTGWVGPAEFLRRIDMLVVPSTIAETFGLVVAEAMSARVPLLITDAGALSEVAGSTHPWVAAAGDPADLAEKIRHLGQKITEGDDALGQILLSAYWRWQELFSPEAGQARVSALLRELASTGTGEAP